MRRDVNSAPAGGYSFLCHVKGFAIPIREQIQGGGTGVMRHGLSFAAYAVAGVLSGCVAPVAGGSAGSAPLARAALVSGDVVAIGPEGYCVDPVTLARRPGRNFAVVASCRILSDGETGPMVEPAVMTVTVGPRQATAALPSPAVMATQAGQRLIGGREQDGVALAHLASGGDAVLEAGDPRYWRAVYRQGSRLVALALYAPEGSPLAEEAGAEMLLQMQDRMAAASAAPAEADAGN